MSKVRLKIVAREARERSADGSEELLTVSHITGVTRRSEKTVYMFEAQTLDGYKVVERGDLVVNTMWAWMGALGVARTRGIVSPSYAVYQLDRREVDPTYLEAYLRQPQFVSEMEARSTGVWKSRLRLYPDDLLDMRVDLPPLAVQIAIADYLDRETERNSEIVGRRQQQLDLMADKRLEAARTSFGHTAGIRRLPWLPPIDPTWPVVHLRWLASCLDGRRVPVNRVDRAHIEGDVPYWGANGIVDWVNRALFDEPLVLLGEDGAPFFDRRKDVAFYVDGPIWPNNHIHVLRAIGVRPQYLALYLNLVDYSNFIEGSTRDKLTQGDMGAIPVPVAPEADQRRIEAEVSATNRRSDAHRAVLVRQVDLLVERRQALFTAAVTGQFDIPGVVV